MFRSAHDAVVPAVTAAQMREVDRVAVEETGPNLYQMMEHAGRSLALTALEMATDDGPIVVLAGTGGNGGGGLAAARHLANRGRDVTVVLADRTALTDVPAFQLHAYTQTGRPCASLSDLADVAPALVVDAVIGYSLRGAPRGPTAELIAWSARCHAPVLALDLPSGIDATTGDAPGIHVTANTTLTLALPKRGLVNDAAGAIILADLGIPLETYRRAGVALRASPFRDEFSLLLQRVTSPSTKA